MAASMTRWEFMPEKRAGNARCSTRGNANARLRFDPLNLDIDALTDLAAIAGAGREQLARVLGGLRFDTPLLHTRDGNGRVEGLERGPLF
jgi:hypothetical protein